MSFQRDARNSGAIDASGTVTQRNIEERVGLESTFDGAITAIDDVIYAVRGWGDSELFALRSDGDEPEWTQSFDREESVRSIPVVVCDGVFVQSGRNLYAIDTEDGSTVWSRETTLPRMQPTVFDGTIFSASWNVLSAYDVETGTRHWKDSIDWLIQGAAIGDETVYLTGGNDGDGTVVALETSDGTHRWERDDLGQFFAEPSVGPDDVYVQPTDGTVCALESETGDTVWSASLGGSASSRLQCPSIGPAGGRVYVSTGQNGDVVALDPADGSRLWQTHVASDVPYPPLVTTDAILVGTPHDGLVVLDRTDGEILETDDELSVVAPLSYADGTVSALAEDGIYSVALE